MKQSFLTAFLFLFLSNAFAQTKRAPVIFGVESGGSVSILPKDSPYDHYFFLRTAPYLEFRMAGNFYAGVNYEIETGELNGLKISPLKGFGGHARYFFPLFKNNPAARNFAQVFGEATVVALDNVIDYTQYLGVRKLPAYSNINTQIAAGINFRLFNSLYLGFALRPMFFSKGQSYLMTNKATLEYHFGEKREKYERPNGEAAVKSERGPIQGLSAFLDQITLGTSLTYLRDKVYDTGSARYREWTLNVNVAVSITSYLDIGIAAMPIWLHRGQTVEKSILTGVFTQYNILRRLRENRLFIETGYYRGNYCTCGDAAPYNLPDLAYIPIGGGYEFQLLKKTPLYLDLSLLFYQILNKIPEQKKYAYSQYVVGLNYHLYP